MTVVRAANVVSKRGANGECPPSSDWRSPPRRRFEEAVTRMMDPVNARRMGASRCVMRLCARYTRAMTLDHVDRAYIVLDLVSSGCYVARGARTRD